MKRNDLQFLHRTAMYCVWSYQGDNKWLLEAEGTGNGEDRVKAGEDGSKEDDLANAWTDGEVSQVVAERGQLLCGSQSTLS